MNADRPNDSVPPPPLPHAPAPPLEYRPGGPEQKSQWLTDGDAYGAAMVYLLLGLTALAAVAGVLWWVVSWILGFWLGW